MIRIKSNKCGYRGYSCEGIPSLTSGGMFDSDLVSELDAEFAKLPVKIKGMVFTEETIDMGWNGQKHPEVAELSCRSDTDPESEDTNVSIWGATGIPVEINGSTYYYPVYGGTNGWADLYNVKVEGSTQYFYRNTETGVLAATSDVYLKCDGGTFHNIFDVTDHIPEFVRGCTAYLTGGTEYEMSPGLLEPMLDTDFDPVGIDTITSMDAGLDAVTFNNIVISNWRGVVDDRFRNVYARLNSIPIGSTDYSLRDLKNEEYDESLCDNFRIILSNANGQALQTLGHTVANVYTVSDGVVSVDDATIGVTGKTGISAPFYAWVELSGTTDATVGQQDRKQLTFTTTDGSYIQGSTVNGGEIVNKTSVTDQTTGITTYTYTIRYAEGDNRPYGVFLFTSPICPEPAEYLEMVGGVSVIDGGTNSDSLRLYKVFEGECVPSFSIQTEAPTADVNTHYPPVPSGATYSAPDYDPGVVYPYDNIVSGTTAGQPIEGSTETTTGWGHSAYVPTVNATYEFVHSEVYGSTAVAPAQALAYAYVTQGGEALSTTYDILEDDILFTEPYRNMETPAQSAIDSAYGVERASYEDLQVKTAAWESAGSPTDPSDPNYATYTAYLEALQTWRIDSTNYDTVSAGAICSVIGGTPGTVYALTELVFSGGGIVCPTNADVTVPSVDAVAVYVHGDYALGQWGTVSYPDEGESFDPYVAHGDPGTVYTVDNVDKAVYDAGGDNGYYYSEVPTVRAMVNYVAEHGGGQVEESQSGHLTITGYTDSETGTIVYGETWSRVAPDYLPKRGTVEVAQEILVGATPSLTNQAVPSVNAIYKFIHSEEINGETASETGFVQALASRTTLIRHIIGGGKSGDRLSGGTPGTTWVAANIYVGNEETDRAGSVLAVPTAEAVFRFVHNGSEASYGYDSNYAFSTATADNMVDVGVGVQPIKGTNSVVGTYYVAKDIITQDVAQTGGGTSTLTATNCVPTAQAVVTYVKGLGIGPSDSGTLKVTRIEDTTEEPPTVTITEGWNDPQPTRGTVQVAKGILVAADETKRNLTTQAVPSVNAVFKFIHGTSVYVAGSTEYAYALARPGLIKLGTTSPYVDGWDSTDGGEPGTTYIAKNICVNPGAASTVGVPTVQAVYAFVHEISIAAPAAGATASRAIATGASVTAPASGTVATLTTGATPGTCYVVTDMRGMQGAGVTLSTSYTVGGVACTLASVVPTVEAVKGYVDLVAGEGGGYDGPFKVNDDGTVEGGDVYFAGASICTAAKRTTALTAGQTAWVVVTKSGSTYTATIGTASSNTATTVSYPVAKNVSGTMTQLHYGALNITGRWM